MDSIKIVDKLTLRQEALRMAVELSISNVTYDAVASAKKYETYLQGSADLPEYVDPNADKQQWVDMLNKMREEMKPNPWISVNSEIKPAKCVKVYVRTKSGSYYSGEYDDGWYVNHKPLGDDIVAWMPIPSFTQPLL